jgi:putative endonuclease
MQTLTTKDTGTLGETLAAEYLRRHDFSILGRNIARKTGEIDILAKKDDTLHFIEVKSLLCRYFPFPDSRDRYTPADNLHSYKIQKVIRTAQWIIAEMGWEGEWQVDGVLVWLRERDKRGLVRYIPQIL